MITGERGIKKKNIPLNVWLLAITRKHKHTSNTTKIDATISKNHKKEQVRRYNIQKSQEKTSTTNSPRNSQPTQRRHTLQYPAQPVAGGYRMQGALWAAGCIVGAWVFRDKKVAHVLQRHACRWVETWRTHSTVYPVKVIAVITYNFEYISSYVRLCCRRILEVQIIVFKWTWIMLRETNIRI